MSEKFSYVWDDFNHKIELKNIPIDTTYEMQQWCQENFGNRWALTLVDDYLQAWYFINGSDATMFTLRWG